ATAAARAAIGRPDADVAPPVRVGRRHARAERAIFQRPVDHRLLPGMRLHHRDAKISLAAKVLRCLLAAAHLLSAPGMAIMLRRSHAPTAGRLAGSSGPALAAW